MFNQPNLNPINIDSPLLMPNWDGGYYCVPVEIFHAVKEVESITKAPLDLILASALGVLSLACQGKINCLDSTGSVSPCSLFFLTIAESGERKSTVDRIFSEPIREFEEAQLAIYKKNYKDYKSKYDAWLSLRRGIISKIKGVEPFSEEYDALEKILTLHDAGEPICPKRVKMVYTDATPEAIIHGLYSQSPSVGLMSDEAGGILNGRAMADLATLNRIWDGATLSVERKNSESYTLSGARLTISLMTQENSLIKFIAKNESLARDIGFLARCFVSRPDSTQGYRMIEAGSARISETPYLNRFKQRIAEIIADQSRPSSLDFRGGDIDQSGASVQTQFMTPAARELWVKYFNMVEVRQSVAGFFFEVRDAASKTGLNAIRLASLYQYYYDGSAEISEYCMGYALSYCNRRLIEFKALFGSFGRFSPDYRDLIKLIDWMNAQIAQKPSLIGGMKKNDIRQKGPIRNSAVLMKILSQLEAEGSISFGDQDGSEWVFPIAASIRFRRRKWTELG